MAPNPTVAAAALVAEEMTLRREDDDVDVNVVVVAVEGGGGELKLPVEIIPMFDVDDIDEGGMDSADVTTRIWCNIADRVSILAAMVIIMCV
mmetsp:Transcript_25506/g.53876  ORF Transcript_25506/g.53876 Transcript_25506/m.53876 type:complete len:92 (-) Transcript_25506:12-287(-)